MTALMTKQHYDNQTCGNNDSVPLLLCHKCSRWYPRKSGERDDSELPICDSCKEAENA